MKRRPSVYNQSTEVLTICIHIRRRVPGSAPHDPRDLVLRRDPGRHLFERVVDQRTRAACLISWTLRPWAIRPYFVPTIFELEQTY